MEFVAQAEQLQQVARAQVAAFAGGQARAQAIIAPPARRPAITGARPFSLTSYGAFLTRRASFFPGAGAGSRALSRAAMRSASAPGGRPSGKRMRYSVARTSVGRAGPFKGVSRAPVDGQVGRANGAQPRRQRGRRDDFAQPDIQQLAFAGNAERGGGGELHARPRRETARIKDGQGARAAAGAPRFWRYPGCRCIAGRRACRK